MAMELTVFGLYCAISFHLKFLLIHRQDQNDADGCWIFKGNYWEMRENPGFKVLDLPRLW